MKQVGILLLSMVAMGLIAMTFHLQGTFWETLSLLVVMGVSTFVPPFKQVLTWKLHWRLALGVGVICTFIILWQLMDRLLGNYQQYSAAATLIVFSLIAFLFQYLDRRDAQ